MIFFAIVLLIMGDVFNTSHATTFESSACGKAKGCYQPSTGIAYSYRILSSSLIEMEFYLENGGSQGVRLLQQLRGLRYHNKYMVSQPQALTDYKIVKESSGLSHKVRHRLNKAHGT
uniref:Secreted protein n=1 Tax=Heterorhabditis bacteriophora TaxID=37862 RepID=A0A1I7XTS8_HETBA